eukprot:351209-Chlamydomonas_euryale.AAC.4
MSTIWAAGWSFASGRVDAGVDADGGHMQAATRLCQAPAWAWPGPGTEPGTVTGMVARSLASWLGSGWERPACCWGRRSGRTPACSWAEATWPGISQNWRFGPFPACRAN